MTEQLKYTVTYGRKVQTQQYESLNIQLTAEFTYDIPMDEAYEGVKDKVEEWLEYDRKMRGWGT
jgi:uncharacterized alkaline shock family protein YloU